MSKNIILSEKHGVNPSITVLGNDKIYILAIDDQGYGTKGIIIKRSALNIPVKGYITLMKENEFDKVFKH